MTTGTEIASLYASIGADTSGLSKGLDFTSKAIDSFGDRFSALGEVGVGALRRIGEMAVDAGTMVVNQVMKMGESIATTGISFDDLKEKSTIAFTTMLGSGDKAKVLLDQLQAFAAKTPFEFPDLLTASQRLLAMGFASDKILPTMTAVGDAVAGLGGGKDTIDHIVMAMGQMNTEGKTDARTMRELTIAGIPAWQMLADKIGKSVPEAMKMVTGGAIDAKTTIDAVTAGMEQKFGGMMDKQSHTWSGLLSNLSDSFQQLSGKVMKPFFDVAEKGLSKLVDWMSSADFGKWVDKATAMVGYFSKAFDDFITQLTGSGDIVSALEVLLGELIPGNFADQFVGVMDFISNMNNAFQLFFFELQNGGGIVSSFLTLIGQLLPTGLLPAWEAFETGLGGLIKNLDDAIYDLVSVFSISFAILTTGNQSWGEKLIAIWDLVYQTGLTIWASLADSLSGLIPQWLNHLGEWATAIWDWIVKATPVALAKLVEWASGLWGWITANLPTWIQTVGGWAIALWHWIVDVTPLALAKLGEWGSALLTYLGANLPGWIATFFGWETALWTWIGNAVPDAINALSNFVASLRGEGDGATSVFWTMVSGWAHTFWSWITDVALPQIAPAFSQYIAAVQTAGVKILGALGNLAIELGKTLWYWIELASPDTAKALQDWWGAINTWLTTTGASWVTTLTGWGVALWSWIAEAFGPVATWLGNIAAQFVSWKDIIVGVIAAFGVLFWPTIEAALTASGGAIAAFAEVWVPVLAAFVAVTVAVAVFRNAWEGDWGGIRTTTMSALGYLNTAFAPLAQAIQQFGGESLKEIVLWATGNQTNFAATQKIWEAAKTSFGTVFDAISAKLIEWGKLAWDWFQTNFPGAARTMMDAVDSIKRNFGELWDALQPLMDKIIGEWNSLVHDWQTGGGGVGTAMKDLRILLDGTWSNMIAAAQFAINQIINLMTLVVQLIDGDWTGAWNTVKEMGRDAWDFLKTITYNTLNTILGLFGKNVIDVRAWMEDVANTIRGYYDQFVNIGRDIVQGLWNGVSGAWGDFTRFLNSLWMSLPESLRHVIISHSPSAVFADIGGDIIAGLAQGLTQNQSLVVDAMGNISTAMQKASSWDRLGNVIGDDQAKVFYAQLNAFGANAYSEFKQGNVAADNPAYSWAAMAMNAGPGDDIATLKNDIDNLASQISAKGIGTTYGANTRQGLYGLSDTLANLLAGGTYSAPMPTAPSAPSGTASVSSNDELLQAILEALQALLTAAKKEGTITEAGFKNVVGALANARGGLADKVSVATGLR